MLCLLGYKMNKRVGGLTEFEFEPLTSGRSLSVTIAVTGWLSEKHHGIAWYTLVLLAFFILLDLVTIIF